MLKLKKIKYGCFLKEDNNPKDMSRLGDKKVSQSWVTLSVSRLDLKKALEEIWQRYDM